MRKYELVPNDGHKSFYGKAIVTCDNSGNEILRSYDTDVIARGADGMYHRLWSGYREGKWARTTARHIKAFSGLNKAEYLALPYEGEL